MRRVLIILTVSLFPFFSISQTNLKSTLGHVGEINSIDISPDGKLLISGGVDKQIILWELETGRELRRFIGHRKAITYLAFNPDLSYFISASKDGTIIAWNLLNGKKILVIADSIFPKTIGFSNDGNSIYISKRGKLFVIDAHTFEHKGEISNIDIDEDIDFSSDNKYVAVGNYTRTEIFDINSNSRYRSFQSGKKNFFKPYLRDHKTVVSVKFHPNSKQILVAEENNLKLFDLEKDSLIRFYKGSKRNINSISIHPEGTHFITTNTWPGNITLWDINDPKPLKIINPSVKSSII